MTDFHNQDTADDLVSVSVPAVKYSPVTGGLKAARLCEVKSQAKVNPALEVTLL